MTALLWHSLTFWDWIEFIALAIVLVGVLGESVGQFKEFPTDECHRKKFEKIAALVLIFGLAVELFASVRTAEISGTRIAALDAEAAEAKQKEAEAEVRLQTLQVMAMPRWLDQKAFMKALANAAKPQSVEIIYSQSDDSEMFANDILGVLYQAGWKPTLPVPLKRKPHSPAYMSDIASLGANPVGITVISRTIQGWKPSFPKDGAPAATPFDSLMHAFAVGVPNEPTCHGGWDDSLPPNVLRIVVGPKEASIIP